MQGAEVLTKFTADTKDFDTKEKSVSTKLSGLAKGIAGGFMKGVGMASTAIVGLTTAGVKMYADIEQSVGGVETLFKNSADTVIANSKKAYETAGLDANTYMEQVTSFSASLLQSLGGDTEQAAKVADMAIIDMADNANKMGTSIESIQNAYQGFAKQNYTMLDNLKLGYGGTKSEMERLLADAEKISGIHYDISNLNDVYQAIHVIQGELGITGTTAKEASETISGSVASAKSAFKNFLAGTGGIEEVVNTFTTAGKNIAKGIMEVFPQIADGLVEIINGLVPMIPEFVQKLLPPLIDGAINLVTGLVNALPQFITVLAQMLPQIITSLIEGATTIIQSLAQQLPTLIPVIVEAILDGLLAILDNVDLLVDCGIQLHMGLINGIMNAVPILIDKAPEIIDKLIMAFTNNFPKIVEMALKMPLKIAEGMVKGAPKIVSKIPQIIVSIVKGFANGIGNFVNVGANLLKGLWDGINGMKDWVINKVKGIGKSILNGLKGILGIHSPSTEFALVGKFSVLGFTEQLDKMSKTVQEQIAETFSVSPQLANSSSLHYSPNVVTNTYVNVETDPLGNTVNQIKTFSGGARNDFNYGLGV